MTTELGMHQVDLVERLADLQQRIKELEEQADEIKDKLRANLTVGSYTVNGKPVISLSPTRRFSPKAAIRILTPELLALCQITVVDAKLARAVLPPAIYEFCQENAGKNQVRLA